MFITKQQLFELKNRLGGQYYGLTMAEIFLSELEKFNKSGSNKLDLIVAIRAFYHRYDDKLCIVKFDDDSYLLLVYRDETWLKYKIFQKDCITVIAEF